LIGCEGSNEVYVPPTEARLKDSIYTVSDTTPTFVINSTEQKHKQLVVDLSCIKDAPEPTDVVIKIKFKDEEVVSYSVTTARSAPTIAEPSQKPARYIVKDGDTPIGLSKKFGVPVEKIKTPLLRGKPLTILP